MERFIKKFFDCFEEEIKEIISNIKLNIDKDKWDIDYCESILKKRAEDANLSDFEYRRKWFFSKECEINHYNTIIIEKKKEIVKNENKLLMYENMKKILSVL
jgi:hypothetical protein